VHDNDWDKRDSDSPVEKYEMRYHWIDRYKVQKDNFGGFFVRDQNSKVFPTAHPPITDGFGTWTVTVPTGARDSNEKLPAVPVKDAICQQETAEILASSAGKNHPATPEYCQATKGESLVYGSASGVLSFSDFVYIFDFCPTGLRGGRDYRVWFSPIDMHGRVAMCPFLCDNTATTFLRSHFYICFDLLLLSSGLGFRIRVQG
jgi:hypothetical protein